MAQTVKLEVRVDDKGMLIKIDKIRNMIFERRFPEKFASSVVKGAQSIVHDYEAGGLSMSVWPQSVGGTGSETGTANEPWEVAREKRGESNPVPGALRNSMSWRLDLSTPLERGVGIFDILKMDTEAIYWRGQEDGFFFRLSKGENRYITPKNFIKTSLAYGHEIFEPLFNTEMKGVFSKKNA